MFERTIGYKTEHTNTFLVVVSNHDMLRRNYGYSDGHFTVHAKNEKNAKKLVEHWLASHTNSFFSSESIWCDSDVTVTPCSMEADL